MAGCAAFLGIFEGLDLAIKTCSASAFWIINCFETKISVKRFWPWNHLYIAGSKNVPFGSEGNYAI
jgi:hypothetical protein